MEVATKRKAHRPSGFNLEAAQEMVRLLDGKPATQRSLALICGVSLATISNWTAEARESMPAEAEEVDEELSREDKVYFERRYRDSRDPDVRAFIESIRTPLRRRP